ncbi:hypothetical protein [Nonomuraea montanisoli]|uniref:hypothetical protein n=1 Tax=Nonomuraea montanisoli TaxID=2741721 RepID=UPI001F26AAF2|nr:hypothetical protein [Nonomuraea montanisoli]
MAAAQRMLAPTGAFTALRGGHVTLAAAADVFLSTPRTANSNTHRAYASAIDRVITLLDRDRLPAEVSDVEIGPATWNRNRAAVASWLSWCQIKKHWAAPSVPADVERRRETADEARAVAKAAIHRLLSRRASPFGSGRTCPGCCGCRTAAHALVARCSCRNGAPSRPAARPPATSARTPAVPASATTASASCSTSTPDSTCTNCAIRRTPPPSSLINKVAAR